MSYEVLAHELFMEQVAQFQSECAPFADGLIHELKVIQANPFANGSRTMHDIADPELVQKLLRRHVGGPSGHRLIFVVERSSQVALPTFVSLVPRAKFDYETASWNGLGWLALCQQIVADLSDPAKFKKMRFAA